MLDGIPIFGPLGDNGNVPTDLDECNGHVDSTYSFYHYHVAFNETYPYIVNCLKGCVSKTISKSVAANSAPACSAATTQYDYSSLYKTVFPASSSLASYSCNAGDEQVLGFNWCVFGVRESEPDCCEHGGVIDNYRDHHGLVGTTTTPVTASTATTTTNAAVSTVVMSTTATVHTTSSAMMTSIKTVGGTTTAPVTASSTTATTKAMSTVVMPTTTIVQTITSDRVTSIKTVGGTTTTPVTASTTATTSKAVSTVAMSTTTTMRTATSDRVTSIKNCGGTTTTPHSSLNDYKITSVHDIAWLHHGHLTLNNNHRITEHLCCWNPRTNTLHLKGRPSPTFDLHWSSVNNSSEHHSAHVDIHNLGCAVNFHQRHIVAHHVFNVGINPNNCRDHSTHFRHRTFYHHHNIKNATKHIHFRGSTSCTHNHVQHAINHLGCSCNNWFSQRAIICPSHDDRTQYHGAAKLFWRGSPTILPTSQIPPSSAAPFLTSRTIVTAPITTGQGGPQTLHSQQRLKSQPLGTPNNINPTRTLNGLRAPSEVNDIGHGDSYNKLLGKFFRHHDGHSSGNSVERKVKLALQIWMDRVYFGSLDGCL
ncbi:hypothetical protein BC829DRAFT_429764 [Chytridium lagenaria]|nr:hypothetical protein BC829DRAFT_429764 [Chytridium lagenaria]